MRRRFFSSEVKDSFSLEHYLTIEALEDGLTVTFPREIEYGIDGIGWHTLGARVSTPSIKAGQTISFKGNFTPIEWLGIGTFTISKKCNLEGNCMSMLFGDNATNNLSLDGKSHAFYKLFYNCTTIINVSSGFLPATTLEYYCYQYMFQNCTLLQTVPALPATTLASGCYSGMFQYCSGLTSAPELPATTLASGCYNLMFRGCTSLTTAPELPATTLARDCYNSMFYNCSKLNYIKMLATDISASYCLSSWVSGVASSGTFVKAAAMTSLPTGTSGIPSGWTVVNDGEESGGGKIVNHGHIGQSTGYYIEWEYPVSSAIRVVFNTYTSFGGDTYTYELVTSINASKSFNTITFGPGESLTDLRSISPIEDDTYIYEIIIEQ